MVVVVVWVWCSEPPKKKCNRPTPPPRVCGHTTAHILTPAHHRLSLFSVAEQFIQVEVNGAAPSPVGDWLRRAFPETKPVTMSRTILALQRQTIRTFDDLQRVGLDGIAKLVYVPTGVRAALREAFIYQLGVSQKYDDGKPVTAVRYVPPKPVKSDDCN